MKTASAASVSPEGALSSAARGMKYSYSRHKQHSRGRNFPVTLHTEKTLGEGVGVGVDVGVGTGLDVDVDI